MEITNHHFWRTIHLGKILGVDVIKILKKSSQKKPEYFETDFKDLLRFAIAKIEMPGIHSEMLGEIQVIEMEKVKLRSSKKNIEKIFNEEIRHTSERERLLLQNYTDLKNTEFIVNSMVFTYESNWDWIMREALLKTFDLNTLLKARKRNCFFLFEKTGSYDYIMDTNVFEYPLTQYQYFLLKLFEERTTLQFAEDEFCALFEINTIEEKKQLFVLTKNLIRELIFRKLIVDSHS